MVIILSVQLVGILAINLLLIVSLMLLHKEKLNVNRPLLFSLGTVNLLTAVSYHPILISFVVETRRPELDQTSGSNAIDSWQDRTEVDWNTMCKILSGI